MVKIRLLLTGKRNAKQYRVVVQDESKRRNGPCVEILGFYNPQVKPPMISLKNDRVDYWKSVGAVVTIGAKKVLEMK